MAATFLIVASMAAATAITMLVYLTEFAKGLGGLPGVEDQLDEVGDQKAQNFLIIGSDVRPDQSSKGLSDTTMLLRVDPDNAITQLSIPRDLRVNIPGHGIDKFNAAYSYGGPKLTLEVVKQLTDNRIPINHVVNVDFNGFADAVDAIGCVYVDVDRHYFNYNATRPRSPISTPRSTSRPATSVSAGSRRSSTSATATRTTTSSAPPASRDSCARRARRFRPRSCSRSARSCSTSSRSTRPPTSTTLRRS